MSFASDVRRLPRVGAARSRTEPQNDVVGRVLKEMGAPLRETWNLFVVKIKVAEVKALDMSYIRDLGNALTSTHGTLVLYYKYILLCSAVTRSH